MKYCILFLLALSMSVAASAQVTSFQIDSSKFNKPLAKTLDSLYQEDQAPRLNYSAAMQRKENKRVIDSLRQIMIQKDHSNLELAKMILDRYGWLGPQKVGMNASQGLFLIIQHADLATQRKYLQMFRDAEKNGEILSSNLAILEDRINMREGKPQQYGSQAFSDPETSKLLFYPIADPDHVDERRKGMGMPPMADYAKMMNTEWNLENYKEMLPVIEKKAPKPKGN